MSLLTLNVTSSIMIMCNQIYHNDNNVTSHDNITATNN